MRFKLFFELKQKWEKRGLEKSRLQSLEEVRVPVPGTSLFLLLQKSTTKPL